VSSSLNPDAWTIPKIDAAGRARGPGLISFAGGAAHPGDLPLAHLRRALEAALTPESLGYGPARGERSLLEALQRHFAREDVDASPERTMVTSGAMAGLDLVFRRLLDPGDMIVVESPTYSDSLISLSLARARVVELPMDDDGAQVEALPAIAAEMGAPRAIYVIPTFHNPTGVTMSFERRRRLVELARDLGAMLIEDDAYGALRFSGEPIPSLAALSDEVISVRSLSKIVAPGLRLGCVIGPPPLVEALELARGGVEICASPLNQVAAARFIRSGDVDVHIYRLCKLFAERRDVMLGALFEHFGDLDAHWSIPEGGMFIWMRVGEDVDTTPLLELALDEGVSFVPGSVFSTRGAHRNAMRLCFTGVEAELIDEGVQRLRAAFERLPEASLP